MIKMTVIQLLNKIANGEAPKKIKYKEKIYEKDRPKASENGYVCIDKNGYYHWLNDEVEIDDINDLNDEVEIIEEDKKIEKMTPLNNVSGASDLVAISQMQWENNLRIERKINEIIDVINKGE